MFGHSLGVLVQSTEMLLCMLQDDDPYVRKTAAVCVAKLFDINPELVEDRGFLDMLRVRPAAVSHTDEQRLEHAQPVNAC